MQAIVAAVNPEPALDPRQAADLCGFMSWTL
jgi:hypothetical protein